LRGSPRNVGWQYAKVLAGVMGPIVIQPTVIINIQGTGIATTAAERWWIGLLRRGGSPSLRIAIGENGAGRGGVMSPRHRLGTPVFVAAKADRAIVRVLFCRQGSDGTADGALRVDSFLFECRGLGVIP
jgi:hypothetical protein